MKKYMNNPKQQFLLDYKNMIENNKKTNLLLLVFCTDVSHSMSNRFLLADRTSRIQKLNQALKEFWGMVKADPILRASLEVSVVSFGTNVTEVRPFAEITSDSEPPVLQTEGITMMAEGIEQAIDSLRQRYAFHLKNATANLLTPVLVILSDGLPTSPEHRLKNTANLCRQATDFKVIPVGIGDSQNSYLHELSDNVFHISDADDAFKTLFEGLVTASISSIGASTTEAYEFLLKSALTWSAAFEN